MIQNDDKYIPKVGEELYLYGMTGDYYCDMVRNPYTVVEVGKSTIVIQEAKLIFNGPRYFDSYPDKIIPDQNGEKLTLRWSKKDNKWRVDKNNIGVYSYAKFGKYDYVPYMN